MDAATRIARTVLYEGYILWPYRRSAIKNRKRWTFGGVHPREYSRARGEDDPWTMQTQCLVETAGGATIDVRVRFLHVIERSVARLSGDALVPVDELTVGGERHLPWDEAAEREVCVPALELATLDVPYRVPIEIQGGSAEEWLADPAGARVGALRRSWQALRGTVQVGAERLDPRCYRLTVGIVNTTPWAGGGREDANRRAFVSTHTVLRVAGGSFISLTDPPATLRSAAAVCRNIGTWPVLIGEPGERQLLLSSPIILYDYPQVAPESPGDLFDGTEIDELLVLNVLAMTDAEREEMRASDPRAREVLDRCSSLTPEELMKLHGAVREFRPIRQEQESHP